MMWGLGAASGRTIRHLVDWVKVCWRRCGLAGAAARGHDRPGPLLQHEVAKIEVCEACPSEQV